MGNWGTSLYAGDFAADLRSTIRAVVRLPFDPDRLADIIGDTEPGAATDSDDEDYTTFWLVLADQFARYGLKSRRVLDTAVEIIDSGRDLEVQRRLGQRAAGLRTRSRILAALRDRLTNPQKPAARRVVGRPEPFVFDAGEALAYPTCGGRCRNPYAADLGRLKIYGPKGGKVWTQDGWGAVAIVERGRAFEYFAWHRPLVVRVGFAERPGLRELNDSEWQLQLPGTCSRSHYRRMAFARVGEVKVSLETLKRCVADRREWGPGDRSAIADISIANRLRVVPFGAAPGSSPSGRIGGIVVRLDELAP